MKKAAYDIARFDYATRLTEMNSSRQLELFDYFISLVDAQYQVVEQGALILKSAEPRISTLKKEFARVLTLFVL
jgi:hypothetical protein